MRRLARSLGLRFKMDAVVHGRYTDIPRPGDIAPRSERIPAEAVVAFDRECPERAEAWEKLCKHLMRLSPGDRAGLLSCAAGRTSCHISADGKVRPCSMLRFMGWDARELGFRSVWGEHIPGRLARPGPRPETCRDCPIESVCGQCPGWTWLENGTLDQPVPYLCEIAHGRELAFSSRTGGRVGNAKEEEAFQQTRGHSREARSLRGASERL